ncbi:MAG: hypothetical protein RQ826_14120 [Xanthomonadales bacterium]|nr:hypothetical protein [Xanthomonadales bacterium]
MPTQAATRILIPIIFLATIALAAALFSGVDWLGRETPVFGIPVGQFVTWGIVGGLCLAAWLLAAGTRLRLASSILLVLAAAWLPVSIALFGNVFLSNAADPQLRIWLIYTGFVALGPILVLLALVMAAIWTRSRPRR